MDVVWASFPVCLLFIKWLSFPFEWELMTPKITALKLQVEPNFRNKVSNPLGWIYFSVGVDYNKHSNSLMKKLHQSLLICAYFCIKDVFIMFSSHGHRFLYQKHSSFFFFLQFSYIYVYPNIHWSYFFKVACLGKWG